MPDQKGKILIVDDTPQGLKMLNASLADDYTVYLATNGEAALRLAADRHPDLILLDIIMPGMDGYEVCRHLKRDSSLADIPVIMVSALDHVEDEIRGLEVGAIDFVTKPFNTGLVKMRVNNHLERRRQQKETQQLYQKIKEQEHFTRSALDGLTAHICVVDAVGTIIYTNSAWRDFGAANGANEESCGVGSSYLTTCVTSSNDDDPDIVKYAHNIKDVLIGNKSKYSMEYPCHSPTVKQWFRCNTSYFTVAEHRYAIIAHENITERKLAEIEMRKLSRAVEQSPASIIMTDIQGKIEFVNPRFTELTGYSAEEVVGKTPRLLQSGVTPPEIYIELWQTISAGDTWHGELVNRRKDGTLFWELTSISSIRNSKGKMTHYLAVCEDITDNKKLIEELKTAKERAEAATRAKSTFLSSMSHEIRTPMNGVIGMTSLLSDTELSSEQREFSETIRKSGESLLDLINDILDFSKIEAGKLELEMLDLDLCAIMEDTAELLSLRAAEKGLELICIVDPAIPLGLQGDAGRVRQIITNLTGNAIKFTSSGEIVISASLKDDHADHATVLFSVRDTGIGIPADRLLAVFAPFTQAEGSTARKFGGTGLGLAICKQLTEIMGGEISVASDYGSGSTFSFTVSFPKCPDGNCALSDSSISTVDIHGAKILIVDDNTTCRTLLTNMLERWECQTAAAADAAKGLALLHEAAEAGEPFQLVLIDMKMPETDGKELGRQIKAAPELAATRMIMISAFGQNRNRSLIEEIGFSGYVAKPVRQIKLQETIARSLGIISHSSPISEHSVDRVHAARTARILLADDHIVNQKVARRTLNNLGYEVDVAANGLEAVRALEIFNYDLVLMDCVMPEMDGFEATATIRSPDSKVINRSVPIIAMTANAMSEDRDHCLRSGMDDYLSKPVKREVLEEMLEKWLAPSK